MTALKIFVTGATGFIGQALVAQMLEQGHYIVAVDDAVGAIDYPNPLSIQPPSPVSRLILDLLNPTQLLRYLAGCDCVVHLARHDPADRAEQLEFALRAHQTLLQACVKAQVKKFILISSTAVYGDPAPTTVITEASPYLASIRPLTAIKQAAEKLILATDAGDTEVTVLQLGMVYGPGAGGETAQTLSQMQTALLPLARSGTGHCNLIYIDDVVAAIIQACKIPLLHRQRFIISAESAMSWRELLAGYESILGERALIDLPINYLCEPQDSIPLFKSLISNLLKKNKVRGGTNAIAKALYGKPIQYFSVDEFRTLVAQPIFSNQKARDHLHFQPKIAWPTGIERIREWWRQQPLGTR